ncbi:MAG: phosphotransferase family protein [Gammaproteobacteria bacterium]|jgi:aminoglycoside phosphotransferase (APT) family kinase protein|nr:MAG: phosphotransferase family protein [Gammaproteobacteria bacterium]
MESNNDLPSLFISYYSKFTDKDLSLVSFERVFGGASRETFRILVKDEVGSEEKLILRRTQESSLIETSQSTEYLAYSAYQGTLVPVPAMIDINEDEETLGAPFMLMQQLDGIAASPFTPDAYSPHEEELGEQFWSILGEIAKKDINDDFINQFDKATEDPCWKKELDKWVEVIKEDSISIEPILDAGIRKLYEKPPKDPNKKTLVHGDYRNGNFLFKENKITGILDWEMAHIGDPLEDLGWALSPIWSWQDRNKPAYLIDRQASMSIWEGSSGLTIDNKDLKWWELFACVKGMAIWISAGNEFKTGKNVDPINLFSPWIPGDIHLEIILDILEGDLNET